MKQILIIPGNTDLNRGDQALVWESVRLAEDVYGKNNVTCVLMSDLEGKNSYLQNRQTKELGYDFVDSLIKHPGRKFDNKAEDSKSYSNMTLLQWGGQAIVDYIYTRPLLSRWRFVRKFGEIFLNRREKETLDMVKNCDAVFVKGGGFIHSYGGVTDPYFIYFLTYHIRLAKAYGKKVFVLPNSIGPLKNGLARRIALNSLRECDIVTVRENISKEYLNNFQLETELFPDLGFFLKPAGDDMSDYLVSHGVPLSGKKVVLTLRPYRFQGFQHSDILYQNYINGFVSFVEYLCERGFHITFMAHTLGPSSHEDDRIAIREVLDALPNKVRETTSYLEDFDLTCKDVEKIYSYYDYMVGTRFHSVIFSLNVGVPSIAIAYGGNKGKGIMEVLGNGGFSLDMDKVSGERLIKAFESLETNKTEYLSNLSAKKEEIRSMRGLLIDKIRARLS